VAWLRMTGDVSTILSEAIGEDSVSGLTP